jgi:hypothetical protein
MSVAQGPCSLCVGCLPEGEWCRACGFRQPTEPIEPLRSPLLEAVRKARGDLRGVEIEESIRALNEASAALSAAIESGGHA